MAFFVYMYTIALGYTILYIQSRFFTARVIQLGNPLKASVTGIDILPEPGVIFLMNDVLLTEGVVFAFSAFFRSDAPVRLQIWRPAVAARNATIQDFTLIFEIKVTPSVKHKREDVSLNYGAMCLKNVVTFPFRVGPQ